MRSEVGKEFSLFFRPVPSGRAMFRFLAPETGSPVLRAVYIEGTRGGLA